KPSNKKQVAKQSIKAIDDTGIYSNTAVSTILVKSGEIIINTDLSKVNDNFIGTYTIAFQTFDSDLQPLNTTNTIEITTPSGCSSNKYCITTGKYINIPVLNQKSTGFYELNFNFEEPGLYSLKISSSANDIKSTLKESPINIFGSQNKVQQKNEIPESFASRFLQGNNLIIGFIIASIIIAAIFFWSSR
ncbi:MAG: hypothetical protein AABY22_17780, partial [Nanoarchaeota archaeon]